MTDELQLGIFPKIRHTLVTVKRHGTKKAQWRNLIGGEKEFFSRLPNSLQASRKQHLLQ